MQDDKIIMGIGMQRPNDNLKVEELSLKDQEVLIGGNTNNEPDEDGWVEVKKKKKKKEEDK